MSHANPSEAVLVVHNAIDIASKKGSAWVESNAGVIDEVNAVTSSLKKLKIDYRVESIDSIEHLACVLKKREQKIVFNLIEELPANIVDACYVPAICRAHGKACTGSDTPALILAQNKWHAKAVLKAAGLPVPAGAIIAPGRRLQAEQLPAGKYIVKPAFSDASEGIDYSSIVDIPGKTFNKIIERVHKQFGQPALVEQFISNREFNVAVLQRGAEVKVLPIAEIDFSAFDKNTPRIVDYSAKWVMDSFAFNNTPRVIPADLPKDTAETIRRYAADAWHAAGCRDYIRVDFRMDENEQPFIIEINPNPDITPRDGFDSALTAAGIPYEKFIEIILRNAESRLANIQSDNAIQQTK